MLKNGFYQISINLQNNLLSRKAGSGVVELIMLYLIAKAVFF
jgi:hypothetical protein